MKKIVGLLLAVGLAFTLAACAGADEGFRIAMITDVGDVDDRSFNQGTWEGIVAFAEENDITHRYYRPLEVSDAAYLDTIALAIEGGAEIVVTPGFLFEPAIFQAQQLYPEVTFVLIDGVPQPGDYSEFVVAENTVSILFDEHESGFLAGYAAVQDGYRQLGYFGGIAVPAVVKFGIGFVAGAYYAADEINATISLGNDRFAYLGNFEPNDNNKNAAAAWFVQGTELIFVAAGGAGNSVMAAAEEAGAKVIGVDVDQSAQSTTVITSAKKELGNAVGQALQAWLDGSFPGGEIQVKGADNDGVGLPEDFGRFTTFTKAQYDTLYARISSGQLVVPSNYDELVTFFNAQGISTVGIPSKATIEG
jgi:Uncharacterized ABC-type transport system, periplasmic component/surface lipoprotein